MKQLSLFDPIEITLTDGQASIIDPVDADLLQYNWSASSTGRPYAARYSGKLGGTSRGKKLHREIAERMIGRPLREKEIIDHINGDTLDNRRSNLRVVSNAQNCWNSKRRQTNASGYKGVWRRKGGSTWAARIVVHGKQINLGSFRTPEEAHEAYRQAAVRHYGEYARYE